MKLQTKDVGKLLDVTPGRVRQLETEGILRAEKTASGTRIFDRDEVERVRKQREKKGR